MYPCAGASSKPIAPQPTAEAAMAIDAASAIARPRNSAEMRCILDLPCEVRSGGTAGGRSHSLRADPNVVQQGACQLLGKKVQRCGQAEQKSAVRSCRGPSSFEARQRPAL